MNEFFQRNPSAVIAAWSPTPQADVDAGKPQAPFTQVHIQVKTEIGVCVLRFKSSAGLKAFIDDLEAERQLVWGDQ